MMYYYYYVYTASANGSVEFTAMLFSFRGKEQR